MWQTDNCRWTDPTSIGNGLASAVLFGERAATKDKAFRAAMEIAAS